MKILLLSRVMVVVKMISFLWSDYIKSAISIYIGSPIPPSFYDIGDDDDETMMISFLRVCLIMLILKILVLKIFFIGNNDIGNIDIDGCIGHIYVYKYQYTDICNGVVMMPTVILKSVKFL